MSAYKEERKKKTQTASIDAPKIRHRLASHSSREH